MSELAKEVATYERELARLEQASLGKFVLISGDEVAGVFDTFSAAADEGLRKFGETPFLVREIGQGTIDLPPVVLYGLSDVDLPHVI